MGLFDQIKKQNSVAAEVVEVQNAPLKPPVTFSLSGKTPKPIEPAVVQKPSGPLSTGLSLARPVIPASLGASVEKTGGQNATNGISKAEARPVEEKPATGFSITGAENGQSIQVQSKPEPILKIEIDTFDKGKEKYTQAEVEEIRSGLEFIKANFDNASVISEAFMMILQSIHANPALVDTLGDEDIGTMVSAMRESRMVHVAKVTEKKAAKKGKGIAVDFSALGNMFKM